VRVKLQDALRPFRRAADDGGHFIMAYGGYVKPIENLNKVVGFELLAV
jgi:hypothetical protein